MSDTEAAAATIILPTGARVMVDETRVRCELPCSSKASSYSALSSAILTGGHQPALKAPLHVLNYKVPADYNGYCPSPEDLLGGFATKEGLDEGQIIIGLLTAASMKTFSLATRSCQGIHVDVIVTSGLSNARSAGAE